VDRIKDHGPPVPSPALPYLSDKLDIPMAQCPDHARHRFSSASSVPLHFEGFAFPITRDSGDSGDFHTFGDFGNFGILGNPSLSVAVYLLSS
jgi:hypothetical protein